MSSVYDLTWDEQRLICAIQSGLPLCSNPYRELAELSDMTEQQVINTLAKWLEAGLIKRVGLVMQHQRMGYHANAMVVWDIPDESVDAVGERLKSNRHVSLCYRRKRRPPRWPYNLYCMIYGLERRAVETVIDQLNQQYDLQRFDSSVLFSTRQFKQRGAHYFN